MRKLMATILLLLSIAARGLDGEDPSRAYEKPKFSQLEAQARDAVDWNTWLKGLSADVSVRVTTNNREGSLRRVSISMERETEGDGHGLLGVTWRHREVSNVELIHLSDRLYVVAHVSGTLSSKAPLGNWHVKKEGPVPAFCSGPRVGTLVTNVSVRRGKAVPPSRCESCPAKGRSSRKQSERFMEVTTWIEALRCQRAVLDGSASAQAVT